MKKKKLLTFVGIVILAIILQSIFRKNGNDYLKDKDYRKAYQEFKKVDSTDDDFQEAQKKIAYLKPKIDSLNAIQNKKDSVANREKKIQYALSNLKMRIKKNMKDPDSYEMIDRLYDKNETGDTIGMLIKFRGNNSFGGKAVNTVFANYIVSQDQLYITNKPKS